MSSEHRLKNKYIVFQEHDEQQLECLCKMGIFPDF